MTVNNEVVRIEKEIGEAISDLASEARGLGCIGIRIGFTQSGGAYAECIFPLRDYESKSTFADHINRAADSIVAAKMMLGEKEDISSGDMTAYWNMMDQAEALGRWLDDDCACDECTDDGEDSAQE